MPSLLTCLRQSTEYPKHSKTLWQRPFQPSGRYKNQDPRSLRPLADRASNNPFVRTILSPPDAARPHALFVLYFQEGPATLHPSPDKLHRFASPYLCSRSTPSAQFFYITIFNHILIPA